MDSLLKLIDNRVQKAVINSSHINSEISQVINVDGNTAKIKMLSTGTEYTLPNYSGSELKVGDVVYVYWKGGFLSAQSAYIGASSNMNFPIAYIYATNILGDISTVSSNIDFESMTDNCTINLVFNAVISATTVGNYTLTIYKDNVAETYTPTGTTVSNGYTNCNFTIPLSFTDAGAHNIRVVGDGMGMVTQIKSYIFGQGIREGGTNG